MTAIRLTSRHCFLLSLPLAVVACWLWTSAILSVPARVSRVVVDASSLANVDDPVDRAEGDAAPDTEAVPAVETPAQPDAVTQAEAAAQAEAQATGQPESPTADPGSLGGRDEVPAPATGPVTTQTNQKPEPSGNEVPPSEIQPVASPDLATVSGLTSLLPTSPTGTLPTNADAAANRKPLLNVQVPSRLSFNQPPRWPGYYLVAVRARRVPAVLEVISLNGDQLVGPLTLDEFSRLVGRASLNRGVLLDNDLLVPVQDRLLPLGGGWQAWMLLDETVWNQWRTTVESSLRQRALTWSQVRSLTIRLEQTKEDAQRGPRLAVADITQHDAQPAASDNAGSLARGQLPAEVPRHPTLPDDSVPPRNSVPPASSSQPANSGQPGTIGQPGTSDRPGRAEPTKGPPAAVPLRTGART
ncbi:MAG: hypothetical protein J5I93_02660 [Pirellulaceae bacterium]|nr:hypothetical protein [Pirellulaceae bacterium]